jgi:membrane-associated phospholipid phosphatase
MSVAAVVGRRRHRSREGGRRRAEAVLVRLSGENGPKLVSLLVVLVGSLTAFADITEDYLTGDPLVEWDTRLAIWLHAHSSDSLVSFFKVATLAGNSLVLLVLVGLVALIFARRGSLNAAGVLVAALGGAGVLNALLKLIFERPRPELAFVHLETYSFPSGHAAVAAATFATLAFLLGERVHAHKALIVAAAVVLIAIVDFSRLYLGVHYLSDVVAGTSFGLSWASICLLTYTLYGDHTFPLLRSQRLRRLLVR